jgi:dienelactone hydrolase
VSFTLERAEGRTAAGRAVWLGLDPDPVLAFLYPPETDHAERTAVLFCPGFGWEEMCSYRGRRAWSRRLAAAGYPAATFGLPGTGDSGGSPGDPDRLEVWTDAVAQAAAWLADVTEAERVCAIGLGLGGLLACRAVASGAPIDDLILWGVPAHGRAWLRELRAYAEVVASRLPAEHHPEAEPDGDREYIGFLLTGHTARELEAIQLTELDIPDAGDRRVLLLGRDGMPADRRLREHFERAGAAVTVQDTDDYGALMTHPQRAEVPMGTVTRTLAWLAKPAPARAAPADAREPRPTRPAAPVARASDLATPTVGLSWGGTALRETPLSLDGPRGRVFAVLSEGVDIDPAPVCAVWLNGGALPHMGPNRAWVEVARRWAGRGVPTVRVDLSDIGDSDGDEGGVSNSELYAPRRTAEALAVLDQLSELGLPGRFVLGGLCSGAYWSLQAALTDARVRGVMLINLYAFFWSQELVAERDTHRSLSALHAGAWRGVVRRHFTGRQIREAILSLRPTRLRAGAGHPVERAQSTEIELALDRVRDQGTQALLLLSRGEGLHGQLTRQGVLDRREKWPNLAIEELPTHDHLFRALWLQRQVHASLDRSLEQVLASFE